jgi:hypothetical protein
MTATPVDRAAASRLVAAQEHAWTAIRTQHSEVLQVVIVGAEAPGQFRPGARGAVVSRWSR